MYFPPIRPCPEPASSPCGRKVSILHSDVRFRMRNPVLRERSIAYYAQSHAQRGVAPKPGGVMRETPAGAAGTPRVPRSYSIFQGFVVADDFRPPRRDTTRLLIVAAGHSQNMNKIETRYGWHFSLFKFACIATTADLAHPLSEFISLNLTQ